MTGMAQSKSKSAEHEHEQHLANNLRRGAASDNFVASQRYSAPSRKPVKKQPRSGRSAKADQRRAA